MTSWRNHNGYNKIISNGVRQHYRKKQNWRHILHVLETICPLEGSRLRYEQRDCHLLVTVFFKFGCFAVVNNFHEILIAIMPPRWVKYTECDVLNMLTECQILETESPNLYVDWKCAFWSVFKVIHTHQRKNTTGIIRRKRGQCMIFKNILQFWSWEMVTRRYQQCLCVYGHVGACACTYRSTAHFFWKVMLLRCLTITS